MDNKIIEEMARIIAFDLCPNRHVHAKWGEEAQCYSGNNFAECTKIKNVVDKLYNAGYRKIPENAVVLTREEYERQQKDNEDFDKFARSIRDIRMQNGNKIATFKDLQDYIELQVKQGSKETAEKFADRLKEKLNEWLEDNEDLDGKINFGIAQIELIGVKSLDGEIIAESLIEEICKEITDKEVQNGN